MLVVVGIHTRLSGGSASFSRYRPTERSAVREYNLVCSFSYSLWIHRTRASAAARYSKPRPRFAQPLKSV